MSIRRLSSYTYGVCLRAAGHSAGNKGTTLTVPRLMDSSRVHPRLYEAAAAALFVQRPKGPSASHSGETTERISLSFFFFPTHASPRLTQMSWHERQSTLPPVCFTAALLVLFSPPAPQASFRPVVSATKIRADLRKLSATLLCRNSSGCSPQVCFPCSTQFLLRASRFYAACNRLVVDPHVPYRNPTL